MFTFMSYFIEIFVYSFSSYNMLQDRQNNIKSFLFLSGISPSLYYVSKFISDLLLNFVSFCLQFTVFHLIQDQINIDDEQLTYIRTQIFIVFLWKCSYHSIGLFLTKFFDDSARLMKYYVITYFLYNWVLFESSQRLNIPFIKSFSDSLQMQEHLLDEEVSLR